MNWWGSGLVTILIYGGTTEAPIQEHALLTENGLNILTENSLDLEAETI